MLLLLLPLPLGEGRGEGLEGKPNRLVTSPLSRSEPENNKEGSSLSPLSQALTWALSQSERESSINHGAVVSPFSRHQPAKVR